MVASSHPLTTAAGLEIQDSLTWNPEDYQFLRDNGFVVSEVKQRFQFGWVHAVMKKGDNWVGAADPNGEGAAAGPKVAN
jgi:gamma-glutamyltranspeptidase